MECFYDLHIHSCLSPCADDDMTPCNIVNMAILNELDIIAVTDHNSTGNCPAVVAAAEGTGLLIVCGMELCTAEEVHVLCFFESLSAAMAFGELVKTRLPYVENNPAIFGNQIIMGEQDEPQGEAAGLLSAATDISISELSGLTAEFCGVCVPAHIDKTSYSVFSNLGFLPPDFPFGTAEVARKARYEMICEKNPELAAKKRIYSSDAHSLHLIKERENSLELKEKTAACVIETLK